MCAGDIALAQTKSAEPEKAPASQSASPQTATPQTAAPAATVTPGAEGTATVEGFRSAKFGMSEADVRTAIGKDFPAAVASIRETTNHGERIKILTFKTTDVLPDSGSGEVAYIFGYKSKALIQVNIAWSKATDAALTPEAILANGEGLRDYFIGNGFAASAVVINVALPDGVLLFRGSDKQGREVLLVLRGTTSGEGSAPKTFTPTSTTLSYIAKPASPDIFKVPAGKF